jgi:hypothetical protein
MDRPDGSVTAERLAQAAPARHQSEVAAMLKDMNNNGLLAWTDSAQMMIGGQTLTNTNLYNIINHYFAPQPNDHPTRFVPTGLDEFAHKVAEWQAEGGRLPNDVVRAIESVNGRRRWTERRDPEGNWVSLTRLWNIYRNVFPLAQWGINNLNKFLYVMQAMGLVSFAWHAWFGRMQAATGTGNRNPVTTFAVTAAEPILSHFDNITGGEYRAPIQTFIDQNQQTIGSAITAAATSTALATIPPARRGTWHAISSLAGLGRDAVVGAVGVMASLATAIATYAQNRYGGGANIPGQ